ncbi:MAG: GNAT family N-acetyltransferase [Saprospiraceae bacterium]|nr:GNAT family N-acetyltransferase [Saprospiraceae bacterium]
MQTFNFSPFPTRTTARLQLRRLTTEDDRCIFTLRSNEQIQEFLSRPLDEDISQSQYFLKNIDRGIGNQEWIYWGLALQTTNKIIGTICLWNFSREEKCAEIGYELHPDYQGQGYMQEAIEAVLEYGFTDMQLKNIEAYLHIHNTKSIRLLIRNKFEFLKKVAPEEKFESESEFEMLAYTRSARL